MNELTQDPLALLGGVVIGLVFLFSLIRGAGSIMNILSVGVGALAAMYLYTSGSHHVTDVLGQSSSIVHFIAAGAGGFAAFLFCRYIGVLFIFRFIKMWVVKGKKLSMLFAFLISGFIFIPKIFGEKDLSVREPLSENTSFSQQSSSFGKSSDEVEVSKTNKTKNALGGGQKFSLFEVRYFFTDLLYKAKNKVLGLTGHTKGEILIDGQYRYDVIKLRGILMSEEKDAIGVEYERILRSPGVQNLLKDQSIVRALVKADYDALYRHPKMKEYIESPFNQVLLEEVKW